MLGYVSDAGYAAMAVTSVDEARNFKNQFLTAERYSG
jgi:hypothetical protein